MPSKILILSASVGAGHLRAAEAIELAFAQIAPETIVKNIDVLTLANKAFRRIYSQGYFDLANRAPHLLGYFYDLLDRPQIPDSEPGHFRVALEKLNMKPFLKLLKSELWDLVVNTHFLPAEIIASLRNSGKIMTPQVTITTDFEIHRLWIHSPCEHYFTATDEGRIYLQYFGVPERSVSVTGIPIHPLFNIPKDPSYCYSSQGITGQRPVILILSGGMGIGPIEKIYAAILEMQVPLDIIVVTGRNDELRRKIEQVRIPLRHHAKILGFTAKMDEMITVADLVVSKPGGLTTAEILAKGAAIAIVNPIPGQESRNSDFLLENGAGIKINNIATLSYKLTKLFEDKKRLEQLRTNSIRLGRPRAAFDLAEFVLKMAQK